MSMPAPINLNLNINCTHSCNGIFCCMPRRARDDDIVIYNASEDAFELVKRPRFLARLRTSHTAKRLYAETLQEIQHRFFKAEECVACRKKDCLGLLTCTSKAKDKPLTKREFEKLMAQASQVLHYVDEKSDVREVVRFEIVE
jgi:hypothetical protein